MGRTLQGLPAGRVAVGVLAVLLLGLGSSSSTPRLMAAAPTLPAPPANGEMAFIVSHFALTYEQNKDDCPDGPAGMFRANVIDSLPASERERLAKPENGAEFTRLYNDRARGPDGTDICTNPELVVRTAQKTVQGRIAQGFNLDGNDSGSAANTCSHPNFTSPAGEAGIDSQAWRAMGCLEKYRGVNGQPPLNYQQFEPSLSNGENAQVIRLRGVDSLVRDDNVEVVYTNTADRAVRDAQGRFTAHASYLISDNTPNTPRRNVLKGRIANGVLEADVPRLQLRQIMYVGGTLQGTDLRGTRSKWDLRRVRLRLTFQPDGSVKGLLGGYQPYEDAMIGLRLSGRAAATTADWDCAVVYATLKQLADGDPDPRTGQCSTISTTYELNAVPAFVIDPQENLLGRNRTALSNKSQRRD